MSHGRSSGAPPDDPWGCVERWLPAEPPSSRLAGSSASALAGVGFGVKANLDVAGVTTTAGTRAATDPASDDAAAVAALRRHGAVPLATTTLAEAAVGSVTRNPWTGTCVSPRDPSRNAGGSSGGSAAFVAAGFAPLALGSDTMGSVRIPAACCAVLGWKPTSGAVSTAGLVPLASALDTVGVLAADAATLLAAAEALLGPGASAGGSARTLRVGVPTLIDLADDAAHRAVDAAVAALGAASASVDLQLDPALVRRRGLLLCEAEAARWWAPQLEAADRGEPSGLSDALLALLRYGRDAAADDVREAERVRRAARDAVLRLLAGRTHVLVLPTLPDAPPAVDDDPPGLADLTAWVNLVGLPAVSVPTGVTGDGELVPRSVQLIGAPGADRLLIELSAVVAGAATGR
jgi:aspartyl-tRNA(Asn)/glutamyl-tRNA(Gln) amidotransferase subunit A